MLRLVAMAAFGEFLMAKRVTQLGGIMLGLIVGLTSGCLHCFHPTPEPVREQLEATKQIPTPARASVYLFLLNGLDPLEIGNLSGVREYVNSLGFGKVYYGQLYHTHWFLDEMRRIRSECPESRFIVLGFEYGADAAHKLTEKAISEGIDINELIYLEPKGLGTSSVVSQPGRRVLTIQANRWLGLPSAPAGSELIVIPRTSLYGIPTHPIVLEILTTRMLELAGSVPVVTPAYPDHEALFGFTTTPRKVESHASTTEDEWDFLKPGRDRVFISTSQKVGPIEGRKID